MILDKSKIPHATSFFYDYYNSFDNIQEFMLFEKKNHMRNMSLNVLPGFGFDADFFNETDIHPNEMEFDFQSVKAKQFHEQLAIVYSAVNLHFPGARHMYLQVIEKNTKKIIGFLGLGSPVISIAPRNRMIGETGEPKRMNHNIYMGRNIVPVQPFGFNYLGGKLLTIMCCSHELRTRFSELYDINVRLFETTSLYGNTKGVSQYDGMKPFLRYKGDTDSNFAILLNNDIFNKACDWFRSQFGEDLVNTNATKTNYKMKAQSKMIAIIRNSMKKYGMDKERKDFEAIIDKSKSIMEQKRYYACNFGIDNVPEILRGETDEEIHGQNYDKHYLEYGIDWWRKKASKRWESLKKDGRLRTELELWTDMDSIKDIIR